MIHWDGDCPCDDCVAYRREFDKAAADTSTPYLPSLGTQVGGDHYRKYKIQPIEYIQANGLSFLAGNIVKYATRYKDKGGAEDVEKIIHYAKLILEFEYKQETK